VLDLGINVPNQDILAACQTYQPTVIGLSGLLVKSAEQMVLVVQDLANAQISVPVMVGGAALSQRFVETKLVPQYFGKVLYCKDPLAGLMSLNK
jgi:5-methyltetrahydrofolate--homocysteine methyltransferase